jgi:hypothetical protein
VSTVDPRLVSALRTQLARRGAAARVGWKVGRGDSERIGGSIAVGHLTAATVVDPGGTYRDGGNDLHADAEVALELGTHRTIAGYRIALEIVDLETLANPEAIVEANIFHRAVAFGELSTRRPNHAHSALTINGEVRDTAKVEEDFDQTLETVDRILAAVHEQLAPGDRIITGSIVQVPIESGDDVAAEIEGLGRVELAVG